MYNLDRFSNVVLIVSVGKDFKVEGLKGWIIFIRGKEDLDQGLQLVMDVNLS